MPHFPKPFFRPKKNRWYVQLDGKQVNLGPDEAEAFRRYHKIMADRGEKPPVVVTTADADPPLVAVFDEFLSWCLTHREKRTYETYKERIQSFLDALSDKRILAKDLRPYHLQAWVDGHADWNPGMKRGRLQSPPLRSSFERKQPASTRMHLATVPSAATQHQSGPSQTGHGDCFETRTH
jgi:hypothetical protein